MNTKEYALLQGVLLDIEDAISKILKVEVVDDWDMVNANTQASAGLKLRDAEYKIVEAMVHQRRIDGTWDDDKTLDTCFTFDDNGSLVSFVDRDIITALMSL